MSVRVKPLVGIAASGLLVLVAARFVQERSAWKSAGLEDDSLVIVWHLDAKECLSCQVDPHAIRTLLRHRGEELVIARAAGDSGVVDGFIQAERLGPIQTVRPPWFTRPGEWVVLQSGRVIRGTRYSPKTRGDGAHALEQLLDVIDRERGTTRGGGTR